MRTIPLGGSQQLSTEERSACCLVVVRSCDALKEAQTVLHQAFILAISGERDTWSVDSSLITVAEYFSAGLRFTLLRNVSAFLLFCRIILVKDTLGIRRCYKQNIEFGIFVSTQYLNKYNTRKQSQPMTI